MNGSLACCAGILLFVGMIFSAGCSSAPSPGSPAIAPATPLPATTTAAPEEDTILVQVPSAAETAIIVTTVPGNATVPSPTPTWVYQDPEEKGDPRIIVLEFRKDYFDADFPDCGMKALFPEVASDPDYGIFSRHAKLVAYTEQQVQAVLQANAERNITRVRADRNLTDYLDTATLGGPACYGMVSTPTWNFVLINATITARNARPAEYAIGFNVRSRGNVVEQIRADRNLTLDQTAFFALYVPLKTLDMDRFDSVELVFARKG